MHTLKAKDMEIPTLDTMSIPYQRNTSLSNLSKQMTLIFGYNSIGRITLGPQTKEESSRQAPTSAGRTKQTPSTPDHVSQEHFSPTLHTAIKQPEEEILAGGVHHIATL